jgi:radical SAM superfamily enzyme YgiQ (UPF0313 family)
MKHLMDKGTRCLIVQSQFSSFSFWNYVDVCRIVGARYPAAPLGLMTVAALLPQHWKFKLVDENVEPLLDDHLEWADIVCAGGMLPQQLGMLSIIERAHRHGRPVILGGPDPSSQPHLYGSADYLVRGEGEISIPLLLQDLQGGCASGEYESEDKADMTNAVVPRFDLIRFQDYVQVGMQFSRGCPFHCEFCDVTELFGRKSRTKSPEQVLKEIQTLYDLGYRGHIDFVDDNFIGNKRHVRETLVAIRHWSEARKHPFFFSTEASINLADDDDLLQLMKDVDFRYVFIGIETPDDELLKLANKTVNVRKPVGPAVRKISSYGMIVNAGFIVGFDNESRHTAEAMKRCIQESGICMAMVGKLYALPKTQLTKRMELEGRLFENSSTLTDVSTNVDQTTSGLNFITTRPRLDILRDYADILQYVYAPAQYYERILSTCISLKPAGKHKPAVATQLKRALSFLKLCLMIGFDKTTGWLYWKTLLKVGVRNLAAFEAAVNLAAMFIHFQKHSQFVIDLTNKEIESLENLGERKFNHGMRRGRRNRITQEELLLAKVGSGSASGASEARLASGC